MVFKPVLVLGLSVWNEIPGRHLVENSHLKQGGQWHEGGAWPPSHLHPPSPDSSPGVLLWVGGLCIHTLKTMILVLILTDEETEAQTGPHSQEKQA